MVTDKIDGHSYDLVYRMLQCRLMMRQSPKVLEIGVQYGLSMDYWKGLFPSGEFTGIDVEDRRLDTELPHQMLVGDAYSTETLRVVERLRRTYDLIVDDGPHTRPSMEYACQHYAPLTAPGGAFVVEDIPDPGWVPSLIAALPADMAPSAFMVDLRHTPGTTGADDVMLVALRDR